MKCNYETVRRVGLNRGAVSDLGNAANISQ